MPQHPLPLQSLGPDFADAVKPADFPKTVLRYRNNRGAESIGLADLSDEDWLQHFGRFKPLPGNMPSPLAIRYHGHQFSVYNPELGDGRGFLYAQLPDKNGRLLDLGTKGSGQTPWSRSGDGRLTLKGGVREILATEMLEALGVNTSKTLSIIETGEELYRNDEPSPARSAVMVRLSHSHIRFGAFQRFAYFDDAENLEILVRHAASTYHPEALRDDRAETAIALLKAVSIATAKMVAQWMASGFVHGVMNTDNMNVTGETFDFGPFRFMPISDPNFVAAYFDQNGLYRFGRQPTAALWNLQQLAKAFTLLAEPEDLSGALGSFESAYQTALRDHSFALLGLRTEVLSEDLEILQALFAWMTETGVSWPRTYYDLFCGSAGKARWAESPQSNQYSEAAFEPVRDALFSRTPDRPERLQQAYFAENNLQSLLIDEIESIWSAIADEDDWAPFEAKLKSLAQMREAYQWHSV